MVAAPVIPRRGALGVGTTIAATVVAGDARAQAGAADPHPAQDRTLTRIAFGSCADQDKEQPIWDAVLAARPDLFVFLGDNIYGDTRDMSVLRAKYAQLAAKPGFKRLRDTTPIAAIWDDHDYGEDDAGSEYPMAQESKRIFLEFFGEPETSARWARAGCHGSYLFGPPGRRVQLILPDLRTHRAPLRTLDLGGKDYETWAKELDAAGRPVPGPYARNPDPSASQLDAAQWAWLEQQFLVPADVRLFASSLQVLADFPGWEAWINFARDHQRLIDLVRTTRAGGVVFLSGDTHYAEISRLDDNVPYPLWDITSSGLTEVWPVLPPNARRVGPAVREPNFGMIAIDWANRTLELSIRDTKGSVRLRQTLALADLAPG
ncbi:MAG: alkaline phosphatase D family protein [Rhodospirillaceae bacterium]|nr:alkaline phosphatase D family protein [Rhodospirillaceae bacterium]